MNDVLVSPQTIRKITWRLVPLLLICYVFAHLDRVNIGFAKASMSLDLHLNDAMYGFGAGLFFISYMIFGVPSNMLLEKFGPKRWIACMMLFWGVTSTAMMFAQNSTHFYILRFLLGVAEAGFFPSIIVYINRWFPSRSRGKITAMFTLAVPLASVLGAPLSGWIIQTFHASANLHGWQWMLMLEGVPVILLGIIILCYLPDKFSRVTWLSEKEKQLLNKELDFEENKKIEHSQESFICFLKDPKLLVLFGVYSAVMLGMNAVNFWMPDLIGSTGVDNKTNVGLLTAIPWFLACIFMVATGASADRHNERRWHLIIPLLMVTIGFIGAGIFYNNLYILMIFLCIATMGTGTSLPMFWQIPPAFLTAKNVAIGVAFISSFGNLASFLAPYLIGWVKNYTGSASIGLYILAILIALGASLLLLIPAKTLK